MLTIESLQTENEIRQQLENVFIREHELDLDEICLLYKLAERYEEDKWLRVVSRFFDKTGKRLSPNKVKALVDEINMKI